MIINNHILNCPAFVSWDVTERCNHNCFYCYNYWRTKSNNCPVELQKSYDEIADYIISKHPVVVTLSGGEPLLIFEQIKQQIIRFYENGVYIRIFTNGSMITEEIAEFCKKYSISLMVSFPSINKALFSRITNSTKTYSDVIRGMDFLQKYKVSFSPNIVVSKMNLYDFEETADWLIERYHPRKLFISRVTRPANASDVFEQFAMNGDELTQMFNICEKIYKRHHIEISGCGGAPFCIFPSSLTLRMFGKSCGAGKNGYCVDMSGNVHACSRDSESLGNIFTDDFLMLRDKLINWGARTEIPHKCVNCKIVNTCRGGCRMTSLDYLRNGKDVDCDANPDNAPARMPSKKFFVFPWRHYKVNGDLKCVAHEDIFRVSYLHHIIYLNKECAEFVLQNKTISIFPCMIKLKLSYSNAVKTIFDLIKSGIVIG